MPDPSPPPRPRGLGPRGSRIFVIAFLLVSVGLAGLSVYVVHRKQTDPQLQEALRRIREGITPPGGTKADLAARRDSAAAADSAAAGGRPAPLP